MALGVIMLASNTIAGGFNFYLGDNGWETMTIMKEDN